MMLKKSLTLIIIMLLVLPICLIIPSKVKALDEIGILQAENKDRVNRIGGEWYVGDQQDDVLASQIGRL